MSTTRLTFLYPHLFRAARFGEPAAYLATYQCRKSPNHCKSQTAPLTTTNRPKRAAFERHGTAVEPPSVPSEPVKIPQPDSKEHVKEANPESVEKKGVAQEKEPSQSSKDPEDTTNTEASAAGSDSVPPAGTGSAGQSSPAQQQAATEAKMQESGPMEAVLHMPPPQATSHPHISTPPYVHHFDSYTLVKQLEAGGYTRAQAITVMKAIRSLLAQNLDVAQEGLVSKSDVDNETYLFRAACSELSSEVRNNRKADDEQTRQQRTHLQHEVDILSQRMSQDLMTLKDDVKGMFNDRRMNVREEQRTMESAIQQINLKISVILNSDSRSDIEGLRWVLIRRSVLGILFMAVATLGTLRYTSYVSHERRKAADEKARQVEEIKRSTEREKLSSPLDAAEVLVTN
ncbi:hypothetical protein F4779DRAFT_561047 [Xylariaceae sp. FL0662B]|nr:hypothetical protein F4779DRAFT_561047 [Xylariaceae sp. FL0662B]